MSDERHGRHGYRQHERIDRRVGELLADAADAVPPDLELRRQVFARLYETTMPAPTARAAADRARSNGHVASTAPLPVPGNRRPRRGRLALAGGLVAALLVFSAFAFARPLMLSWFGDSSLRQVALQDGTLINRSATAQGITVHLEEGYADAARTVLTMQITGGDDTRHPPSPFMPDVQVVDASGNSYGAIGGQGFNQDWLFEFLPLPTDVLGTQQSLTLTIGQMQQTADNPTPVDNPITTIPGLWQIDFQLRPQAGRVIPLDVAPEMHGGITLQPELLALGPAGVRLTVRVTGLPADTSVFSLMHFQRRTDEIVACPPGEHVCGASGGGTSDGSLMQLRGPDGQTMLPAWIAVTSPAPQPGVTIGQQMVGPSGAAELEFLFFAPLHATSGTAHANFDSVRMASTNPNADERIIPGPWSFALPLG